MTSLLVSERPPADVAMPVEALETPCVIIDEAVATRNIQRMQDYCDNHGLTLRPHIKTHKLPHFAHRQMEAGAVGITCQKLSEAEAMADAGISDILITYNILGAAKLDRLRRLRERVPHLAVTADNAVVIEGLSRIFSEDRNPLPVLIECETGTRRCGAVSPHEAADLAALVSESPGLAFRGLMTYPPAGGGTTVATFMAAAKELLAGRGIPCPVVSSGGSPDMWSHHTVPGVTEVRIGTYLYNDRSLVDRGICGWDDCALRVRATIVSAPAPGRAVIDAGSKTLTSDLQGQEGFGHVLGQDDVRITKLNEEHGRLEWPDGSRFTIGQTVDIVPNHACVVSNMMDVVWLSDGIMARPMTIVSRGGVT
ncbi:MAG: alanine racemase [Pseudomonadota bacterium]